MTDEQAQPAQPLPPDQPPPANQTAPPDQTAPPEPERVTLGGQFGNARTAFRGLIDAHIALAKAELADATDLLKVLAGLAGGMLGCGLLAVIMLFVGGMLFLGEWLFGSIGWGFAHGVLLAVAVVVNLALAFVGATGLRLFAGFFIALIVTIVIAVGTGSNVAYDAAGSVGANLSAPFNTPGVLALIGGAIIGAILFALLLARVAGRNGFIGGLVLGLFLGALVGWVIAGAPWTWPPAVGFAITIGLICWSIFAAVLVIPGLDIEARFSRLYPRQSIEAAEETKAWLEEQWRNRRPTLGRK